MINQQIALLKNKQIMHKDDCYDRDQKRSDEFTKDSGDNFIVH